MCSTRGYRRIFKIQQNQKLLLKPIKLTFYAHTYASVLPHSPLLTQRELSRNTSYRSGKRKHYNTTYIYGKLNTQFFEIYELVGHFVKRHPRSILYTLGSFKFRSFTSVLLPLSISIAAVFQLLLMILASSINLTKLLLCNLTKFITIWMFATLIESVF